MANNMQRAYEALIEKIEREAEAKKKDLRSEERKQFTDLINLFDLLVEKLGKQEVLKLASQLAEIRNRYAEDEHSDWTTFIETNYE